MTKLRDYFFGGEEHFLMKTKELAMTADFP
jgi:hypothetical protein